MKHEFFDLERYDNYSEFLVNHLDKVNKYGKMVFSRNGNTKELQSELIHIENNRRRIPLIRKRLNNPIAMIRVHRVMPVFCLIPDSLEWLTEWYINKVKIYKLFEKIFIY